MLLVERNNWIERDAIGRRTRIATAGDVRAYVIETRGTTLESRALGGVLTCDPERAQIAIPLEGELVYRRNGSDLLVPAGHVGIDPEVCFDERWCGRRFRLLMLEFPSAALLDLDAAPVDGRVFAAAKRLADQGFASPDTTRPLVDDLLATLRASGLVSVPERMPRDSANDRHQVTASALATVFSNLPDQPQLQDLGARLGCSNRHARRLVNAFLRDTGLGDYDFRSYLGYHRLMTGALYLSAGHLRVDDIARALGYGSSRAFATACRRGGLPSPGEIRQRASTG